MDRLSERERNGDEAHEQRQEKRREREANPLLKRHAGGEEQRHQRAVGRREPSVRPAPVCTRAPAPAATDAEQIRQRHEQRHRQHRLAADARHERRESARETGSSATPRRSRGMPPSGVARPLRIGVDHACRPRARARCCARRRSGTPRAPAPACPRGRRRSCRRGRMPPIRPATSAADQKRAGQLVESPVESQRAVHVGGHRRQRDGQDQPRAGRRCPVRVRARSRSRAARASARVAQRPARSTPRRRR